ncbi:glutathione S-transferase family protein [Nitratireductor basaltis]|uniref:Glutathione S-transferase n=1 Tax=Nitratireductor basaltis TaxID=472175 RepID=A0A084UD56_9HYPH|nr:glutathione S-transferase family protein [Nitratireductor basaltis]KFB10892.1 Glutathione S-transferase [Nitratireductor basaltis]
MELVLYNSAHSTCSQKVRLVLEEKGLHYQDIQISSGSDDLPTSLDYSAPVTSMVPTLVHGSNRIAGSSSIAEYLDEVFPEPPLVPWRPDERARMRSWLRFVENLVMPAVQYPSAQRVFNAPAEAARASTVLRGELQPSRGAFMARMRGRSIRAEEIEFALAELRCAVQQLDLALSDGREWIMGGRVTLADLFMAPSLDRAEDLGLDLLDDPSHQYAREWFQRMRRRPSYHAAFYPGSRLSELIGPAPTPGNPGAAPGSMYI